MKLTKFAYNEFPDLFSQWEVKEFSLGDVNLLVGVNASGKSRTLTQINNVAKLLTGAIPIAAYNSGHWTLTFDAELADRNELSMESEVIYELSIRGGSIESERFKGMVHGDYLTRDNNGLGNIYYAPTVKNTMPFQMLTYQLAVVAKRDSIQHPFLDPLNRWASSLRSYRFGADTFQQAITFIAHPTQATQTDSLLGNEEAIIPLLIAGKEKFGPDFTDQICGYMNQLGYPIAEIQVNPAQGPVPINVVGGPTPMTVTVIESDRNAPLMQSLMSAGMYRALAILVRAELARRLDSPHAILIDDIGEGLDFGRAKALIRLLIQIAEAKHLQLIMSTNDRFVMNEVPLDYWCVVVRNKGTVRIINRANSPEIFERFEQFGFNNFDFFAKGFYMDESNPEPLP